MAEYIEKNAFIDHLQKDPLFPLIEPYGLIDVIKSFQTADAQPVKWIPVSEQLPPID